MTDPTPIQIMVKTKNMYRVYRIGNGHGKKFVWADGDKKLDAYGIDITQAWSNFEREHGFAPDISSGFTLVEEYIGIRIPTDRKAPRKIPAPKTCIVCGNTYKHWKMVGDRCTGCHEKHLSVLREDARTSMEQDLTKYADRMEECTTGVCDMLAVHHDRLIDDENRLTTDFMIGQICGEEMRQKYLKKTMGGRIE